MNQETDSMKGMKSIHVMIPPFLLDRLNAQLDWGQRGSVLRGAVMQLVEELEKDRQDTIVKFLRKDLQAKKHLRKSWQTNIPL